MNLMHWYLATELNKEDTKSNEGNDSNWLGWLLVIVVMLLIF